MEETRAGCEVLTGGGRKWKLEISLLRRRSWGRAPTATDPHGDGIFLRSSTFFWSCEEAGVRWVLEDCSQ
jgi:hypothetical protein